MSAVPLLVHLMQGLAAGIRIGEEDQRGIGWPALILKECREVLKCRYLIPSVSFSN